jgi:hypothetical protein
MIYLFCYINNNGIMDTCQKVKRPKRKPFQLVLNERERKKASLIADALGVSAAEAVRHALMTYTIETN